MNQIHRRKISIVMVVFMAVLLTVSAASCERSMTLGGKDITSLSFVPATMEEMSIQTDATVQRAKLWDDEMVPRTADLAVPRYLIDLVTYISNNPPEIIKEGTGYEVCFPYRADRIRTFLPNDSDYEYRLTCEYDIAEATTVSFDLSGEEGNTLSFGIPAGVDIKKICCLNFKFLCNNEKMNNLWTPELSAQFQVSEGKLTDDIQIQLSMNKGASSFIWMSYCTEWDNTNLLTIDVPEESVYLRLYYETGNLIDWW